MIFDASNILTLFFTLLCARSFHVNILSPPTMCFFPRCPALELKVLGVNLVQKVPDPLERTSRPLLNHGPDVEVTTYPREEWRRHYAPLVQAPNLEAFGRVNITLKETQLNNQVLQQARVISAVEHYLGGPVEPAEAACLETFFFDV